MKAQAPQTGKYAPPLQRWSMQRKCACGNHTMGGECEKCSEKREVMLQRTSLATRHGRTSEIEGEVPPIVHEVLHSSGQPLDPATRAFFEPRFGHDFSQVRVHSDVRAAESARAVNALAYTVGRDVVFGTGQYAPQIGDGKRLLAHELAHVLQQRSEITALSGDSSGSLEIGAEDTPAEREAHSAADRILSSVHSSPIPIPFPYAQNHLIQRQPNLPGPSPFLGQTNLTIDDRGRVDITVAGPATTPVVSSPTIGLRRDPSGQLHLLVGGKDKVISISDIPNLLRQVVAGQAGGSGKKPNFRVPTCAQLTLYGGREKNRFMAFEQYQIQQRLWHSKISPLGGEVWLELTRPFFDALIELCMRELMPFPRPSVGEKPSSGDFPERILPEGSEYG